MRAISVGRGGLGAAGEVAGVEHGDFALGGNGGIEWVVARIAIGELGVDELDAEGAGVDDLVDLAHGDLVDVDPRHRDDEVGQGFESGEG